MTVDDAQAKEPWRYSLRGLLAFMTLTSVCLAIGVHFAGFMFAFVVIGAMQAAMLLFADWLVRPGNRRALALVTAASWTAVGSALLLLAASALLSVPLSELLPVPVEGFDGFSSVFGLAFVAAAALCYYIAIKRWRQLTANAAGGARSTDSRRYEKQQSPP